MPFRIIKDRTQLSFADLENGDPYLEQVDQYMDWLRAEIKMCEAYKKARPKRLLKPSVKDQKTSEPV